MATYRFAGTGTVCGVTYAKKLRKVDDDQSADEIDITGGGDTEKKWEAGLTDQTCTFEAIGSAPAVGAKGAVSVVMGDGSSVAMANAVCTKRKVSGSVGQAVVYSFTVRPTDAP